MVIYTKYSNERRKEFCIRTEIAVDEQGRKNVRKLAAFREAAAHVRSIAEKYRLLVEDLDGTGLRVNSCKLSEADGEQEAKGRAAVAVCFPYQEGCTLEEELDGLLKKGKAEELLRAIRQYFAMFYEGAVAFEETEEFRQVFGAVEFSRPQPCRRISDIDMIFSNAIHTDEGYELIDYEWTFAFPVPVRYLRYRCLYYYILGNTKRDVLVHQNLYELFDINEEERAQFEKMERHFQAYMLGEYKPLRALYGDISEGVIAVQPLVQKQNRRLRAMRTVEVYFDDGRGYGTWNFRRYQVEPEGRVSLRIELPEGTKALRIDPCAARSVVRVERLAQEGKTLDFRTNGAAAPNGDLIFDTEDPQLLIDVLPGSGAVEITYRAEPVGGLTREVLLNQCGRIQWMEQTKVWKAYRKLKPEA